MSFILSAIILVNFKNFLCGVCFVPLQSYRLGFCQYFKMGSFGAENWLAVVFGGFHGSVESGWFVYYSVC